MLKFKVTNISHTSKKGKRNVFMIEVGKLLRPGESCVCNRLDSGSKALAEAGVLKVQEGSYDRPPIFLDESEKKKADSEEKDREARVEAEAKAAAEAEAKAKADEEAKAAAEAEAKAKADEEAKADAGAETSSDETTESSDKSSKRSGKKKRGEG